MDPQTQIARRSVRHRHVAASKELAREVSVEVVKPIAGEYLAIPIELEIQLQLLP
jgi:hypothetical protein